MNTELIKKLVEQVESTGSAKYRAYVLSKNSQGYALTMNQKPLAQFVVTGYEQGYLAENAAKTPYQVTTVTTLQKFLTGNY